MEFNLNKDTVTRNKLQLLVSKHIQKELNASYNYRQLRTLADVLNWNGFAAFYQAQVEDESEHAEKLISFLESKRIAVKYYPLIPFAGLHESQPLPSIVDAALRMETELQHFLFEAALEAEEHMEMADYRELLDDYLSDQVQEVEKATRLFEHVMAARDNFSAYWLIDRDLFNQYTKGNN